MLYSLVRSRLHEKVTTKEGYLSVTIGWLALILSGTLPYVFSGEIKGFLNILFETFSGYTTTGSSILREVESLTKSLLFWRSLTCWIGGIGIILLVVIILPTLRVGGYNLFSLESSLKEKLMPKTKPTQSF
jgi:trk system potassium uptake protein TrkH